MQWLVRKFDYTTGRYDGTYWDLSDVDYFVDSSNGDDTNSGQYDPISGVVSPFKNIAKVKSLGAGIWENGLVVMINGQFDPCEINKAVRIIGAGGGLNDKAIIEIYCTSVATASNLILENLIVQRTFTSFLNSSVYLTNPNFYFNNCIFIGCYFLGYSTIIKAYSYNTIFIRPYVGRYGTINYITSLSIYGSNSTIYDRIANPSYGKIDFIGNNNHINTDITTGGGTNTGSNNIVNTDGQYLDAPNLNFNFSNVSPLFRTGTFDVVEGYNNHVGAGQEGLNFTALDDVLNDEAEATYNNLIKDVKTIYRDDETIDEGNLIPGYFNFGAIRKQFYFRNNNSYDVTSGKLIRLIQETNNATDRDGLDYYLKYGLTTSEVDSCPWLLCEWGKWVRISGTGETRKGNADPEYDKDDSSYAVAQYAKVNIKFKDRS